MQRLRHHWRYYRRAWLLYRLPRYRPLARPMVAVQEERRDENIYKLALLLGFIVVIVTIRKYGVDRPVSLARTPATPPPSTPQHEEYAGGKREPPIFEKPRQARLSIIIMGKAGTGKSTLIRALFGKQVKRTVKDFGTPSITSADLIVKDMAVEVTFWTSPGIYRGISSDHERLLKMKEQLEESDLVIYALRMDDTRLRPEDIEMMQKMSRAFGDALWEKGIVALTFANRVYYLDREQVMGRSKEHLVKRQKQWDGHLEENLREGGISESVITTLPVVPVGYYAEIRLFPEDDPWMEDFVRQAALRILREDAKLSLLKLTHPDIDGR